MALHLVKLCVGVESPDALEALLAGLAEGARDVVRTRQTPRRASEITSGGSLYWVFGGLILARQAVGAIETLTEGAARRCEIHLDRQVRRTTPFPRRAFQGWRYLAAADAPADFDEALEGELPADLARRLRAAGAW